MPSSPSRQQTEPCGQLDLIVSEVDPPTQRPKVVSDRHTYFVEFAQVLNNGISGEGSIAEPFELVSGTLPHKVSDGSTHEFPQQTVPSAQGLGEEDMAILNM
jgi:hypothetical protein